MWNLQTDATGFEEFLLAHSMQKLRMESFRGGQRSETGPKAQPSSAVRAPKPRPVSPVASAAGDAGSSSKDGTSDGDSAAEDERVEAIIRRRIEEKAAANAARNSTPAIETGTGAASQQQPPPPKGNKQKPQAGGETADSPVQSRRQQLMMRLGRPGGPSSILIPEQQQAHGGANEAGAGRGRGGTIATGTGRGRGGVTHTGAGRGQGGAPGSGAGRGAGRGAARGGALGTGSGRPGLNRGGATIIGSGGPSHEPAGPKVIDMPPDRKAKRALEFEFTYDDSDKQRIDRGFLDWSPPQRASHKEYPGGIHDFVEKLDLTTLNIPPARHDWENRFKDGKPNQDLSNLPKPRLARDIRAGNQALGTAKLVYDWCKKYNILLRCARCSTLR